MFDKKSLLSFLMVFLLATALVGLASLYASSDQAAAALKHVVVYHQPEHFAGWPANNGVWIWGNEILVGFGLGYLDPQDESHSIARDQEEKFVLARSIDGGETWSIEDPENFAGDNGQPIPCPGGIRFTHPDFALRVGWVGITTTKNGGVFFVSYDRGRTWEGPYELPDFGKTLTARTDYIVNGPNDCLVFLSAKEPRVEAGLQDRAFCVRTRDAGKTFQFLSWMSGEPITVRSVMPSTVRVSDTELVSLLRRRLDLRSSVRNDMNWIDAYRSPDNGKSWEWLTRVAYTDLGKRNGNPPSLVRLRDGRLCVTYGYRSFPYGIRAKISRDNGRTWGPELHLREDGRSWDLGYTRSVQRPDGKIVTIYYYTTQETPAQHIAATIWEPDQLSKEKF